MLCIRFPLSLRNAKDLLHERGVGISHETVRYWWNRFGPMFAAELRRKRADRMLLAAVAAGLVDTHASAISVAMLVASGKITPEDAVLAIFAGLTSNIVTKIVMAAATGGWAFALRVVPGLVLVVMAGWAGMFPALFWP